MLIITRCPFCILQCIRWHVGAIEKKCWNMAEGRKHLSFFASIKLSHSFRGQKRFYLTCCCVRLLRLSGGFVFKLLLLRLLGGKAENKNELFARLAREFTADFRPKIHSIPIRSAVSGPALSLPGTPPCAFCIILFVLHEQLENMQAFRRVPAFRPWRTMKCLIHDFQHTAITAGTVLWNCVYS